MQRPRVSRFGLKFGLGILWNSPGVLKDWPLEQSLRVTSVVRYHKLTHVADTYRSHYDRTAKSFEPTWQRTRQTSSIYSLLSHFHKICAFFHLAIVLFHAKWADLIPSMWKNDLNRIAIYHHLAGCPRGQSLTSHQGISILTRLGCAHCYIFNRVSAMYSP